MLHHAKVVIIGSGIVGAAAAYHLAELGWRDILVLDKGPIPENDGSTSHAPGGVVALSHNKLLTRMSVYSSDLYASLAPYSRDRNTYNAVGSLEVAISQARWEDLVRLQGESVAFGSESVLLSPAETQARVPYLDPDAIAGSLFVPKSAIVAGSHVTGAFARDAEASGAASFVANTAVTDIEVEDGRVRAVRTNNPEMERIECECVLICSNIWAPALSARYGVHLPLMAFEHQYVETEPLDALSRFDPSLRDDEIVYPTIRELDSAMYYRHHWNAMGVGSYWHRPHMVAPRDVKRTAMHPFTPQDFVQAWQQAERLVPIVKGASLTRSFNGMFAFSVDGMHIIGESHIKGLWTAVASWITHAGGVAKSVAEWMVQGETEWDMRQCHIHRFQGFQSTQSYIDVVTAKNYREVYDIIHPRQPITEPRNVRLSPFHSRHMALDAEFTVFAGLELPNWYGSNARLLEKYAGRIPPRSGWAAQFWSPIQGAEHLETRENVALFDLTGLSLIEVQGEGAARFVNYLCSNQMDKAVGSVIYTTWLTPSGGIKRDLAVARLAPHRYWMFVGEGTLPQDLDWVRRNAPDDGSVAITDVSDSYTALGLWGPNARQVLASAGRGDFGNEAFPYFTCQWIEIGPTRVLALRVSYAGELGWELHMPMDAAIPVWDRLWSAGRTFDMVAAGSGAFDSLRLEKGYRLWGGDIYTEYNPYEAGLGWTVRTKKSDFIGRAACLELKQEPLGKRLCCLTLDDPRAILMGYEPIFDNEDCVGHVTSANYGYSVGRCIAYGYLPSELANVGTALEIVVDGERRRAIVSPDPMFDPHMERLKA